MTDFFAAVVAGLTQVSIGHPFDTIKVLIQNNKSILNLKFTDYYRGVRYPLFSSIIVNTLAFPTYERTIKYTNSNFISGLLSGFMVSPFVFMFDVGKIKQQTLKKISYTDYFFNKGRLATYTREMVGFSVYFGTYNYFREKEYHPLISGGLAGLCNWSASYPIDVVKSRQISKDIGIIEAIKMGKLWKGFHVCAIRALLVNGGIFYSYDTTKKILDKIKK